jgi:hypothetical protein
VDYDDENEVRDVQSMHKSLPENDCRTKTTMRATTLTMEKMKTLAMTEERMVGVSPRKGHVFL